ncbi:MAG: hypothetical protein IPK50_09520 [Fibrobacterota bacterium]|nr:hypothetical protein [Fibrobacterota bacterium]QQS07117.1 MAG: hypothetical protein IPK50_09520 [Fibrobacterota bacterium]
MEHLVSDAISYIRRKSDLCNPANYYREFSIFEEIPVINRISIIDKLNFKDPIIRSRILLQTTTFLYWDLQAWLEKTEQQQKENLFVPISYTDPLEELIDYNVAIPRLFVSQKMTYTNSTHPGSDCFGFACGPKDARSMQTAKMAEQLIKMDRSMTKTPIFLTAQKVG